MSDDPTRLQRILDQLTVLMDQLAVQTWYLTDEDTYGLVNQAHAQFLGRDKDELEGRRLEELFPPAVAEICRRSNRIVLESRAAVEVEEWVTDARGELRLLEITKTPSISAAGTVSHIICSGQDITRRRAAEERRAQSEANFRTLVETLDDLVLISGAGDRILHANPSAVRKLDYADSVLQAMTLVELHPTWDKPEAARSLEELVAGTRPSCRLPLRNRQGGLIPVETWIWAGTWNGQPCRFGLCKDLSKEQESQQKFETLFRRNPALMAINEAQTLRFVDINEAFVKVLGYSREELLGRTGRELELFPDPEQQARVAEMVRTYGKVEEVALHVRDKAGQLHTGLFAGDMVERQGCHCFLTVMVDITERRRAAAERERVIVELRAAMDQIKTLKGIVPICAKCKKIRDDRGYWQQVEAYISQRTEANFSHGLCPDCAETLYVQHGLGDAGGRPDLSQARPWSPAVPRVEDQRRAGGGGVRAGDRRGVHLRIGLAGVGDPQAQPVIRPAAAGHHLQSNAACPDPGLVRRRLTAHRALPATKGRQRGDSKARCVLPGLPVAARLAAHASRRHRCGWAHSSRQRPRAEPSVAQA